LFGFGYNRLRVVEFEAWAVVVVGDPDADDEKETMEEGRTCFLICVWQQHLDGTPLPVATSY
jgi:hypothetical protein